MAEGTRTLADRTTVPNDLICAPPRTSWLTGRRAHNEAERAVGRAATLNEATVMTQGARILDKLQAREGYRRAFCPTRSAWLAPLGLNQQPAAKAIGKRPAALTKCSVRARSDVLSGRAGGAPGGPEQGVEHVWFLDHRSVGGARAGPVSKRVPRRANRGDRR